MIEVGRKLAGRVAWLPCAVTDMNRCLPFRSGLPKLYGVGREPQVASVEDKQRKSNQTAVVVNCFDCMSATHPLAFKSQRVSLCTRFAHNWKVGFKWI